MVGRTISVITIRAALHRFVLPRIKLSNVKPRKARLILVRPAWIDCLPDGRNDALRMVGSTMWTTAPGQPPGWIRGDRQGALLYNLRLSRNLVRCRLGGKCESILGGGSTSLITTPGPQYGTTHGCRRLMEVPGFGAIVLTALVAAIGNGISFRKGRDLAAWLGVVPRQHSTGGKPGYLASVSWETSTCNA